IGPSSLRSADPATSAAGRFPINRSLTPLFPYRDGVTLFMCGLVCVDQDEIGLTRVIEQLASLLTSPAFSRMSEVADIVWDSIQSRMRAHAHPKLYFQQTYGSGEQAIAAGQCLAPGYLAVVRDVASQPAAQTLDTAALCVVNGSLRRAGSGDFRQ